MDSEKVQIKPMAIAAEEDLIDFRLSHPDTLAKQASRQIYLLDTSYLPSELKEAAAQANTKRSEGLELDVARYTLALKRARKAAEAQKIQQQRYVAQTQALSTKCAEHQHEIASQREQLELAKQKRKMHDECSALAKQLNARPRKKAELNQLIGDIEKQIEEQTKLIAAYQAESAARIAALDNVTSAVTNLVEVEKVEADRTETDIAALDKIISTSKTIDLASDAASSGKSLDPKASVFKPSSRPVLPTSVSSGPAAGSRAVAHSRKGKSASASNSRSNTPGSTSKAHAAAAVKSRAEAPTRKAATAAGRKEPNAPRPGGRRQAVNAPSQLGKSSISMEDGEISSNTSQGDGAGKQAASSAPGGRVGVAGRGGKSGDSNGGESAGGNKRHRADQEDGEATKRRKVEEGKPEGPTGA
ncbi:hypothetical protein NliqN6_4830 [Naganishia liquefaciens]|uniref:Uncharacterized protein n=1 Tax=Naganishia liquefaciens TaxID=104408 RepID=A0A8H3TX34_9TREE|nr:hypothetical protein NliqN6_4830 [Naganishia liquefaciens]